MNNSWLGTPGGGLRQDAFGEFVFNCEVGQEQAVIEHGRVAWASTLARVCIEMKPGESRA